ncbi:MAG: TRAP transporter small permease [Firmicutes bacterium]|nr:TRAP transporter small permease [Bacillota bacterium]
MKAIKTIIDIIRRIESFLLVLILAVIVATTFLQVVGRFTPLPLKSVFEEVATFSFVWLVMIGGGACAREWTHMTMDFVVSYMPQKAKNFVKLLGDICGCGVGIGIIYAATKLIPRVKRAGMLSAVMMLPIWIQNLSLAIGAGLILFWSLLNIVQDIYTIATGKKLGLYDPLPKAKEDKA